MSLLGMENAMSECETIYITESAANKVKALIDEENRWKVDRAENEERMLSSTGEAEGEDEGEEDEGGGEWGGISQLRLRVFIAPGGCQGFEYGFAFDNEVNDDDVIIDSGLVEIVVNRTRCLKYLSGATIDYQKGVAGEKFVVFNPNAKNTCGCGASFCDK